MVENALAPHLDPYKYLKIQIDKMELKMDMNEKKIKDRE